MCVHIHTYIHMYVHCTINMHKQVYYFKTTKYIPLISLQTVDIHTYIHTCKYTYKQKTNQHIHTYKQKTHIHTQESSSMRIHIHTFIHTYIHTYVEKVRTDIISYHVTLWSNTEPLMTSIPLHSTSLVSPVRGIARLFVN